MGSGENCANMAANYLPWPPRSPRPPSKYYDTPPWSRSDQMSLCGWTLRDAALARRIPRWRWQPATMNMTETLGSPNLPVAHQYSGVIVGSSRGADLRPLASPQQDPPPCLRHLKAKAAKRPAVAQDAEVGVVPARHRGQPCIERGLCSRAVVEIHYQQV